MAELLLLSLYCLAILIVIAVIFYIWLSRRDSEKRLEKKMEKSKDNL